MRGIEAGERVGLEEMRLALGIGAEIEKGTANFETLEKYMLEKGEVTPNVSGRQEYLENVINRYFR